MNFQEWLSMIRIKRGSKIIKTVVSLTPSKSITNRLLIIQALSEQKFKIANQADADDSRTLARILEDQPSIIDAKDAGTAFRFLTAFLSMQPRTFILTGSERMKMRPVGELVRALQSLGAEINFLEHEDFPPLQINGKSLKGGEIKINASESSQFISALLLIAPKFSDGLKLELTGKIYSRPYLSMTISLMRNFGIEIFDEGNEIYIPHQSYKPVDIKVENDWSSASFWYEIAGLSERSEITLIGLSKNSVQGDVVIAEIMEQFGIQSIVSGDDIILVKKSEAVLPVYFEYDFSDCPDLVIPVAVLCAVRKINSRFTGVKNLRIKESDRLVALKEELQKFGVDLVLDYDSFLINSFSNVDVKEIFQAHNDHRMVMSLAPLALIYDDVLIDDHLPVSKSYPDFWNHLVTAGFQCEII